MVNIHLLFIPHLSQPPIRQVKYPILVENTPRHTALFLNTFLSRLLIYLLRVDRWPILFLNPHVYHRIRLHLYLNHLLVLLKERLLLTIGQSTQVSRQRIDCFLSLFCFDIPHAYTAQIYATCVFFLLPSLSLSFSVLELGHRRRSNILRNLLLILQAFFSIQFLSVPSFPFSHSLYTSFISPPFSSCAPPRFKCWI